MITISEQCHDVVVIAAGGAAAGNPPPHASATTAWPSSTVAATTTSSSSQLRQQASDDEEKCLLTPTSEHSSCPFEDNEQQQDDEQHLLAGMDNNDEEEGPKTADALMPPHLSLAHCSAVKCDDTVAGHPSVVHQQQSSRFHDDNDHPLLLLDQDDTATTAGAAATGDDDGGNLYGDEGATVAAGVGAAGGDCCSMGVGGGGGDDFFFNSPLIYSEPALPSAAFITNNGATIGAASWAYSDIALPQGVFIGTFSTPLVLNQHSHDHDDDQQKKQRRRHHQHHAQQQPASEAVGDDSATGDGANSGRFGASGASRAATPKSSSYFLPSESQPSIGCTSSVLYLPHKQSFSIGEIRDTHMQIQKRYRPSRRRHYTDPVDFEGILNIIGGCSWWQIWVYLLISLQQIPHAMFNLSVVYMMYQPDHWCKVPGLNTSDSSSSAAPYQWDVSDTLHGSVVYPRTRNKQRDMLNFHSQCHYYDRGEQRYDQLRRMPLEEAQKALNDSEESADIRKCSEWYYDKDVMRSTIVTEWNLVCDDNFKRAHAHLFYSFGFLFGCLLGGFASDRFGRKPTVIGFGILSSMFGLLLPYSTYFPMFLFIRFCGAVCNEAADLAAYVLCMEITGTRYRAMVGSLLQAPWAVGYATLALIAYFCNSWQNIQLITAALHTVSICLICVLPESPRWLIVNNRVDEAERYIRKACRDPPFPFNLFKFNKSSLPCDLELVKHAEQRKWVRRNQRANILHLLKSRALCMRTGVICVVWMATALVYYGIIIALSDQSAPGRVLFSGNFFLNNAVAGAIELPTLIFCVYLMKYGRKRSQIFTLVTAAIFILLAMASMSANRSMLSLGLMLLGKIFIQGGFNILYIFTSELYPTVIRNSAVGFCSMIARFGSGVSSYIAILSDVTLSIVPMIIFATFSLFAGTLVMLLPETRDQPLPDTLQDAVTILKDNERPYQCRGFGTKFLGGSYSVSATELMQQEKQQQKDEDGDDDDDDDERDDNDGGDMSNSCRTRTTSSPAQPQRHNQRTTTEEEEEDEQYQQHLEDNNNGDEEEEAMLFDVDRHGTATTTHPGGQSSSSSSSSASSPAATAAQRTPRKRSDTGTGGIEQLALLPSIPEEDGNSKNSCGGGKRERRRTTTSTTSTTTPPSTASSELAMVDAAAQPSETIAAVVEAVPATPPGRDDETTPTTSTTTASCSLSPSSALSLLSSSSTSAAGAVFAHCAGGMMKLNEDDGQQQQKQLLVVLVEEDDATSSATHHHQTETVSATVAVAEHVLLLPPPPGTTKQEEDHDDRSTTIARHQRATGDGADQAVQQQQQQCMKQQLSTAAVQFDAVQANMLQATRKDDVPRVVASM